MCGNVGMVGTLGYKHKKAMAELLFLDTLRGRDSTGLAAVRRNREVITRKMPIPGYEFIEHPAVGKVMEHNDQVWIGHNRLKTTGDVSKANAHPFEVLDEDGSVLLVGAHNGTLNNHWGIERELGAKFGTDSEALFNLLVKAPNFKEAIGKLEGAWSLVFWDATKDTINFIRNKERPLTFAFSKDRNVLVWASEAWMILAACRRNDVELETDKEGRTCWSTLPDHLYTMEIPQEFGKRLPELEREGGYSGAPSRRFQGAANYGWWDNSEDERYSLGKKEQEAKEEGKKTGDDAEKEDEKKLLTMGMPRGTRRGYDGQPLEEDIFNQVKSAGCGWCNDPIDKVYAFIEERVMVCGRCLSDTHPKDGERVRQEDSDEYKRLIAASSRAATATLGR